MTKKAPKGGVKKADSYHHGDLRAALIEAGFAMLKKEGAHQLSLREVARRVGVSHMAPYRHFPDKEALLAAIAQTGFEKLGKKVSAAIAAEEKSPLAQMEAAAVAYVRFALEDTEHIKVMFGGFISDRTKYPATREAAMSNFEMILGILSSCQSQGLVRKMPVEQQALAAWSAVHGIAMLLVENQLQFLDIDAKQAEEVSRFVARTVLAGLKA